MAKKKSKNNSNEQAEDRQWMSDYKRQRYNVKKNEKGTFVQPNRITNYGESTSPYDPYRNPYAAGFQGISPVALRIYAEDKQKWSDIYRVRATGKKSSKSPNRKK